MSRRFVLFVVLAIVVTAFDQGSKAWARTLPVQPANCSVPADLIAHRCSGEPQAFIDGIWEWELAMNTGMAFSRFTDSGLAQIALALIAAIALVAIGIAVARLAPEYRLRRVAYALVAGGALGNLIDRLRDGAVTDFIRWRIHDHRWPIFNVADAALLVGVSLLLVESALSHRRRAVA